MQFADRKLPSGRGRIVADQPIIMWFFSEKLTLSQSVAPAAWISDGLRPWGGSTHDRAPRVASFLPDAFESYARILHPVRVRDRRGGGPAFLAWTPIAERNGKTVHPLMQFNCIDGLPVEEGRPGTRRDEPGAGSLEETCLHALVDVLSGHTNTFDSCWFCLWEGYGGLTPGSAAYLGRGGAEQAAREASETERLQAEYADAPRVKTDGREYILFSGHLNAADAFMKFPDNQSLNIWWPNDHAWCVATEIDLQSTYVGGSAACIDSVLNHPVLEAFPVNPGDRIDFGSDTINC
ncbi:MAG: hypothetical protein J4N80_05615 [Chloroflexi bacterium]|nr:hypothetical protein [Chloroflexota bacterium]MCI0836666.1 hypothetical protein [Chloroflexota bacterium]